MAEECKLFFKHMHVCAIVPTYNNAGTVADVLNRLTPFIEDIFVVNDGSTDTTSSILNKLKDQAGDSRIRLVEYTPNQGKGHALREGFYAALNAGFDYAITIDSDGQHYPEDMPRFAEDMRQHPDALIVGNRKLVQANMPGKNSFANYFSNFWFMVQTWQYLPDTQTGYRLYPLRKLKGLSLLTSRYEAELELLVFASWGGTRLVSTPIRVYYPPQEERVSHFRPVADFARISVLNTILCVLCLCYGWWAILLHRLMDLLWRTPIVTYYCLGFALVSAMLYPLPVVLFNRVMGRNSEKAKLRYHRLLCRYFRFLLYHIPRVNIRVDNPYNETFSKPAVVICNHQSHLDLLAVLSLSPRIVAMTNQWVWNFIVYKPVLRYLEYYPASEGLENSEFHIGSLVDRGYSVVIFPEGTRSAECKILKFHRGAFYLAERLECDIVPIYLDGPGRVIPKKKLRLHAGNVTIHIGKRVHPKDQSMGANYRENTRYWHQRYLEMEAEMRR